MKIYSVEMNGKTYAIRTDGGASVIGVMCCDTARPITSAKTTAKLMALVAGSEQFMSDYVEALAMDEQRELSATLSAKSDWSEREHAEALEMNIGVDNEINTAALAIAEIRKTTEPGSRLRSSQLGAVLAPLLEGLATAGARVCPAMLPELVERAVSNKTVSQRAGEYFRRFQWVSEAQLRRFEGYAFKKMKGCAPGAFGDLWLNAEGELVARALSDAHS